MLNYYSQSLRLQCQLGLVRSVGSVVVVVTGPNRIGVGNLRPQASGVQDLETALDRLMLNSLEPLEGMNCGECRILSVADLVADVHLVIVDTIHNTISVLGAEDNDHVVVVTELITGDELIYTIIAGDNGLLEVKSCRTDVSRSLIGVLSRSDLPDQVGTTKDADSHVGIIQYLE